MAFVQWLLTHSQHERSIIHRDIKPENIWLLFDELEQPFVKLAGFEMATTIGDDSFSTSLYVCRSFAVFLILESIFSIANFF